MKKFAVTDEKLFGVCKAFDRKNNSNANMRASYAQLLEKAVRMGRKTPEK